MSSAALLLPIPLWAGLAWGWIALWIGLGVLTLGLVALLLTRWGQSQPLHKCIALSLLVHLLLALYAATVHIAASAPGSGFGHAVHVALREFGTPQGSATGDRSAPWEQYPADELPAVDAEAPARTDAAVEVAPAPKMSEAPAAAIEIAVPAAPQMSIVPVEAPLPQRDPLAATEAPETSTPAARPSETSAGTPKELPRADERTRPVDRVPAERVTEMPVDLKPALPPMDIKPPVDLRPTALAGAEKGSPAPTEAVRDPNDLAVAPTAASPAANASSTALVDQMLGATTTLPRLTTGPVVADHARPQIYELRFATDHTPQAERGGGSADTEAAVKAALRWLARSQSPDGRWDARRFGAGQEVHVLGQDRRGAGAAADTGITGLALLAFLGSGHTHTAGEYQTIVARGLDYLLRAQGARGELGGQAEVYAFMYCHGMASLALSEAYAMTGDSRLLQPLQRAVAYTVAAQNRATGGWRYRPGDVGDMSQFGWQLMFLKSADLAGITIDGATRERMKLFLSSASSGKHGGLASYRVGEKVSRTMTAEAIVCRVFLGAHNSPATLDEGAAFVGEELPGSAPANFYFWYYATLGLYQLHDSHWELWNRALQDTLLAAQRHDGALAGSWDPDPVWGSHGGRVFSTALATLCFEVYYRYLPLHVEAAGLDRKQR